MKGLAGVLAADDFDKAKLATAITELRTSHDNRAMAREKFLLGFVDLLTPAERQMLGRKILERVERRERWHGKFNK